MFVFSINKKKKVSLGSKQLQCGRSPHLKPKKMNLHVRHEKKTLCCNVKKKKERERGAAFPITDGCKNPFNPLLTQSASLWLNEWGGCSRGVAVQSPEWNPVVDVASIKRQNSN